MLFSCLRSSSFVPDSNDDAEYTSNGHSLPPPYHPPSFSLTSTSSQLSQLRALLDSHKLTHYLIPTSDSHGSEYTAPRDARRAFISGFTGSAGTAIVPCSATERALLFVDGRYHVQAGEQVDSEQWKVMKVGLEGVLQWDEWLEACCLYPYSGESDRADEKDITNLQNLPSGSRIGLDGTLFEVSTIQSLQSKLNSRDITLVFQRESDSTNLIDQVWGDSQPPASTAALISQVEFAGQSSSDKLSNVRKYIREKGAEAYIVHNLSEIAWLLNLRGRDIPFCPVFEAYLLVKAHEAVLFVDERKVQGDIVTYLKEDVKVQVKAYKDVWATLKELPGSTESIAKVVMNTTASFAIYNAVQEVSFTLHSLIVSISGPSRLTNGISHLPFAEKRHCCQIAHRARKVNQECYRAKG